MLLGYKWRRKGRDFSDDFRIELVYRDVRFQIH